MAIQRINWTDLDGHDGYAEDFQFMQDEWVDQIEDRFRAVTYKGGTDTNGVATGLEIGTLVDKVVVGTGVAYDNATRSRIVLEEAVTLEVSAGDVGKYITIEMAASNDPVATRLEAHPETGIVSAGRQVYDAQIAFTAVPTASQVKLGILESWTSGTAPVVSTAGADRQIMSLGTAENTITATPFRVVGESAADFATIQEAVDSLPNTGGYIFIKPGTYKIKTPVQIAKNGVQIEGAGGNTRIICDPPPYGSRIVAAGGLFGDQNQPGICFIVGDDTQLLDDDLLDSRPGGDSRTKDFTIRNIRFDTIPTGESELGSTRTTDGLPQTAIEEQSVVFIRVVNGTRVRVRKCQFNDSENASRGTTGIQVGDNSDKVYIAGCAFNGVDIAVEGDSINGLFGMNDTVFFRNCTWQGDPASAAVLMGGTDLSRRHVYLGSNFQGVKSANDVAAYMPRRGTFIGSIAHAWLTALDLAKSASATRTTKNDAGSLCVASCAVGGDEYGVNLASSKANLVAYNNFRDNALGPVFPTVLPGASDSVITGNTG